MTDGRSAGETPGRGLQEEGADKVGRGKGGDPLSSFRPRRLKRWLLLRLLGDYADALEAQGKDKALNATLDLMDSVDGRCHAEVTLDD